MAEEGAPRRTIGPYEVLRTLGRGAMGEVYLARHPELDTRYALKVLARELVSDSLAQERFEREMAALARVDQHPGIVRVHSAGRTEGGRPFFAMEYVEGRTLREVLGEGAEAQVLDLVGQVAEALGFAHARGVIHRDVKPENVLVTGDGQAKMSDFGLVRIAGAVDKRLTASGDTVGTPMYMAPEQVNATWGEVGPWSDVFSLGAILYEALCGKPPFWGETSVAVYEKLRSGARPTPVRRLRPDVHPELERVIEAALAHRPRDRYPHAAALAADLALARRRAAEAPRRPRWLTALATACALSLVLGAAAAAVGLSRRAERARQAALEEVEAHLRAGRGAEALAGARALRPGGEDGPRVSRLIAEAVRLELRAALAAGEVERARALLDETPAGAALPERPWVLALNGDFAGALAAAGPDVEPRQRARLAAWAGDDAALADALAALPNGPREALAAQLGEPRAERAPGSGEDRAAGGAAQERSSPRSARAAGAWGAIARGERALAAGRTGLAAVAFTEALAEGEAPGEARLEAGLGALRAALAAGEPAQGSAAWSAAWQAGAAHPLDRARLVAWAAVLLQAGAPRGPLAATLGGDPLERARAAPGVLAQVAPALLQTAPATTGRRAAPALALVHARAAAARGEADALATLARAAWPGDEAGAAARLAAWGGSLARAEVDLGRRGRLGPAGLLLARAWDQAALAEAGASASGARDALALAARATALNPGSAALGCVEARAALALHDPARAEAAATRAAAAAPRDPWPALLLARAADAALEPGRVALSQARAPEAEGSEGAAVEVAAPSRALADALGEVVQRAQRARELAPSADPHAASARLLEAAARLEAARARAAAGEGSPDPAPVRALLAPLLAGLDLDGLRAARAALAAALEGDHAGRIAAAEDELGRQARPLRRPEAVAALRLLASARGPDAPAYAEALLAVAGDLPARALLARRTALHQQGDASLLVDRAWRLDPALPWVRFDRARVALMGLQGDALLDLAAAARGAPELGALALTLLERDPPRTPPPAGGDALACTARALVLLASARRTRVEAERAARAERAYAAAHEALLAGGPSATTAWLRAEALALLAARPGKAPVRDAGESPWSEAALAELRLDLAAARAGAPHASASLLAALPYARDPAPLAEVLLAQGFLANHRALHEAGERPPGPNAARLAELLRPLRRAGLERIELDGPRGPLQLAAALQESGLHLELAVHLRVLALLDRAGRMGDPLEARGYPLAGLLATAPDPVVGQAARVQLAAAGLEEAAAGEPTIGVAAETAARRARPGGPWGAVPEAIGGPAPAGLGLAPEAGARDPRLSGARALLVPAHPELWDVWLRLRDPGALAADAAALLAPQAETPFEPAALASPTSRSSALLAAPLDARTQRRGARWLLASGRWDEALLALERSLAGARTHDALARTAWRVAFWELRWRACELDRPPAERRRAAELALGLVRRTQRLLGGDARHTLRALEVDLLLDLAGLAPPGSSERAARAQAAAARSYDPERLERSLEYERALEYWRRLRLAALRGDAAAAERPVASLARGRGHDRTAVEELAWEFGHFLRGDSLLEVLRAFEPAKALVERALRAATGAPESESESEEGAGDGEEEDPGGE